MTSTSVATARRLSRINTSYLQAKVLQTAASIGLFDYLATHPGTAEQICAHYDFKLNVGHHFLEALVGLEVLERKDGVYHNRPEVVPFLTSDSETYLGGSFSRHNDLHYKMWADLYEALQLGAAKTAPVSGEGMWFEHFDPERAREGFKNMDAFNGFTANELVTAIDWTKYGTVVDIGGSRGNVVGRLVTAHPHLTGKVFDVPGMVTIFDERQKELGTADKVTFYPGDFRSDPLPTGDVYILGHVLPYWREEIRVKVLSRVYEVMNPGGLVLIYDNMLEPDSVDPHGHLLSLLASVNRVGGEEFTTAQCRAWVEQAGFRFDRVVTLAETPTFTRLMIAAKGQ
jgi:SAM-dependent methyltransferase